MKKSKLLMMAVASAVVFAACAPQQAAAPAEQAAEAGAAAPAEAEAEVGDVVWPTGPITITVPFNPGGATDIGARTFQHVAQPIFGQTITVDNQAGGAGAVWFSQGHLLPADGYSVTAVATELAILPLMQQVPFNTFDYRLVARNTYMPASIAVRYDSPFQTMEDFIEYALQNPGQVTVGNSGIGSIWDIHTHILSQATGAEFNHVPYEGSAPAAQALLAGEIDATGVGFSEIRQFYLDGLFRVLGVSSAARLGMAPDVPTMEEQGIYYSMNVAGWTGLGVPADTPEEIVQEFSRMAGEVLTSQEYLDMAYTANMYISYLDADDFTAEVENMIAVLTELFAELGMLVE